MCRPPPPNSLDSSLTLVLEDWEEFTSGNPCENPLSALCGYSTSESVFAEGWMFVADHSMFDCPIPQLSDLFTHTLEPKSLLRDSQIEAICVLVRDKSLK